MGKVSKIIVSSSFRYWQGQVARYLQSSTKYIPNNYPVYDDTSL